MLHLVGCLYYLYQWCTVKHLSDNEIYLLIKYIKSVLWRVAKCLSYIEEARCLKVNCTSVVCSIFHTVSWQYVFQVSIYMSPLLQTFSSSFPHFSLFTYYSEVYSAFMDIFFTVSRFPVYCETCQNCVSYCNIAQK